LKLAGGMEDDEVIVPALTFVATANAVRYCGAFPHFADSEERTLGLAPEPLRDYLAHITERRGDTCVNKRTGRVIRAVVPMHTFGHPADMEGLLAVARDFNLALIEDAAESLGSLYHGRHTGTFGLMGVLSFNGNKIITSGGGGALLTNDGDLAKRAKHLTTTAKLSHRWQFVHDEVGYNYRLPNINAALGLAQLEQLEDALKAKRHLHQAYAEALKYIRAIRLLDEPEGCRANYWLQTIALDQPDRSTRDAILHATNGCGITTRPLWTPLNRLRPFRECPTMGLPTADRLEQQLINVPSSPQVIDRAG